MLQPHTQHHADNKTTASLGDHTHTYMEHTDTANNNTTSLGALLAEGVFDPVTPYWGCPLRLQRQGRKLLCVGARARSVIPI